MALYTPAGLLQELVEILTKRFPHLTIIRSYNSFAGNFVELEGPYSKQRIAEKDTRLSISELVDLAMSKARMCMESPYEF